MNIKKGFTLIELLIVVAIVGILAGAVVVTLTGNTDTATENTVKLNVTQAGRAVAISEFTGTIGTLVCPTGLSAGAASKDEVRCNVSGSNWVVYQKYRDNTADDAYCIDEALSVVKKVDLDTNTRTPAQGCP